MKHYAKIMPPHLSLGFLITAVLASISLGAFHALEGDRETGSAAAYLAPGRNAAPRALLIAILAPIASTAGVSALGAGILYASRSILPEQLWPWFGLLSGLAIAALGAYMLLRRWIGRDLDHAHPAGVMHGQGFSTGKSAPVFSEPTRADLQPGLAVNKASSLGLGMTGGILPRAAALAVLLGAIGVHRFAFGLLMISAFSIGQAAVLIGLGLLTVSRRRFATRRAMHGSDISRRLPVASAAFIMVLGAMVALRGLAATGLTLHSFSQQRLGPALFVAGLGLVLGIRHSTDADHVVAISTIVTRQRSIRGAALIGSLWGLGHTLTIFAVGCLIILGGVVIPPRIGLSMEFSVGLMLILLGVLNLTGVMQKIVARLTPPRLAKSEVPEEAVSLKSTTAAVPDSACIQVRSAHKRYGVYNLVRPLAIGLVHGLAGSAAVALLVLSTIHNPLWAVGYLVIFGGGTMLGMMCMTAGMSLPLVYASGRLPELGRYLSVASGLVSLCFGSFLVYQLGYLNGLFTGHPHWTPQ